MIREITRLIRSWLTGDRIRSAAIGDDLRRALVGDQLLIDGTLVEIIERRIHRFDDRSLLELEGSVDGRRAVLTITWKSGALGPILDWTESHPGTRLAPEDVQVILR